MKYTYLLFVSIIWAFCSCNDNIEPYEEVQEEFVDEEEDVEPDEEKNELVKQYSPILEKVGTNRMLWASINGATDTGTGFYKSSENNKVLVSWRLLPTDNENISFDLYRKSGKGERVKLNEEPITTTNFQDTGFDPNADNTYYLTRSGWITALDTYTIKKKQVAGGLPYISIPLKSTADFSSGTYAANDASVGDLDGDGIYEIVVKRLYDNGTSVDDDEEEKEDEAPARSVSRSVLMNPYHLVLLEAYRLDGTFLWRVKMGPNIQVNNGLSFGVYDFDGDGRCEIAVRTMEGTVFGDGTEIGDTDGDGIIDYRKEGDRNIHRGPEFMSVLEGISGCELARTNYIPRGTSEEWGDDYYKRSNSFRLGVVRCDESTTSILMGRRPRRLCGVLRQSDLSLCPCKFCP